MSNGMTGSGIPFRVRVGAAVTSRARTHDESRSESGQSRGSESGHGPLAISGVGRGLGHKSLSGAIRKAISVLLRDEWIEYTVPDKPNSCLQKYRLPQAGERALREWTGGSVA